MGRWDGHRCGKDYFVQYVRQRHPDDVPLIWSMPRWRQKYAWWNSDGWKRNQGWGKEEWKGKEKNDVAAIRKDSREIPSADDIMKGENTKNKKKHLSESIGDCKMVLTSKIHYFASQQEKRFDHLARVGKVDV